MDLDQALHPSGPGCVVRYAIADVAACASGAIDAEARRRGQTLYAPDRRAALHPPRLSESSASLLADGTPRPAQVWTIRLDAEGRQTEARVERAMVRSRAKLTYPGVQADLDAGRAPESLLLLRTVGDLRLAVERDRGGVSLEIPEQEIHASDSHWQLRFRTPLPVESWNAQISLLTGGAAAQLMKTGGRTARTRPRRAVPVDKLRRTASPRHPLGGLHVLPKLVRSLDPGKPAQP
jgi:exoribonuclease R